MKQTKHILSRSLAWLVLLALVLTGCAAELEVFHELSEVSQPLTSTPSTAESAEESEISEVSEASKASAFESIWEKITEKGEEESAEESAEEPAEEPAEEVPADDVETTEAPEETRKTAAPKKPDSTSTTAKGYTVTVRDGVTYVDGVLVANKTYSLPASYNPGGLTAECDRAYDELKAGALQAGYSLYISSGFRDYGTQEVIYNRYVANDGKANADRYSARPGHSEHQTGLAIDLNGVSDSFGDTATGQWVAAHCHEYGFILRYPKGKEAQTGYMYEPWHIRYVGVKAATAIYKSGLCLEEYYGITSEYAN